MGTEVDIAQGIRRSWTYAKAAGVDQVFSDPSALKVSEEFKEIAADEMATYEEVYLNGLAGGQYNILLVDYAFLQFGGSDEDTLRYAYYPNPFLGASPAAVAELASLKTFVDENIIDMDEFLHQVSEIRYSQHPPLIRYENSRDQYRNDLSHPCSHFHFGHHSGNRWAVRRILTPGAFSLIILKHFYGGYWKAALPVPGGRGVISLDDALAASKRECRILPDDFFSKAASQQFFWG